MLHIVFMNFLCKLPADAFEFFKFSIIVFYYVQCFLPEGFYDDVRTLFSNALDNARQQYSSNFIFVFFFLKHCGNGIKLPPIFFVFHIIPRKNICAPFHRVCDISYYGIYLKITAFSSIYPGYHVIRLIAIKHQSLYGSPYLNAIFHKIYSRGLKCLYTC